MSLVSSLETDTKLLNHINQSTLAFKYETVSNLKTQFVPRSKHSPPRLYKPIIQCCIENYSQFLF